LSHSGKLFVNVNVCSFLHAALWYNQQGRNEGAMRAQLPGRRITLGALKYCGGAKKSQQCHTYILQYSTFASGRSQVRKWGRRTCILLRAPSNLVTPMSIWRWLPSRNLSTHFYAAKLRCRQTVDSWTALAIALKLVFHFGGL